jgi:hypothetical protein
MPMHESQCSFAVCANRWVRHHCLQCTRLDDSCGARARSRACSGGASGFREASPTTASYTVWVVRCLLTCKLRDDHSPNVLANVLTKCGKRNRHDTRHGTRNRVSQRNAAEAESVLFNDEGRFFSIFCVPVHSFHGRPDRKEAVARRRARRQCKRARSTLDAF